MVAASQGPGRRARLLHVLAAPESLGFFRGQVAFLGDAGFDVSFAVSEGHGYDVTSEGAARFDLPISRGVAPIADARAVAALVRLIRRLSPDIVHGHMSKGGLLALQAAALARVPVRLYTNHGMALLAARGPTRLLLEAAERLTCRLSDRTLFVSPSVRDEAVRRGIVSASKALVHAPGGFNGVDTELFDPRRHSRSVARNLWELPHEAPVVGFVGRLCPQKGLAELVAAWARLREVLPETRLLLAGEPDPSAPPRPSDLAALHADPRVCFAGHLDDVAPAYAAMDVLVLPSLYEGLPIVALEASAMALPIVATSVCGTTDAVLDRVTGTLTPPGDVARLVEATAAYLGDAALRQRHGQAGRAHVARAFSPPAARQWLLESYRTLLRASPVGAELAAGRSGTTN